MTDYESLIPAVKAVTAQCPHFIANLANTSALIWEYMDDLNWAGFYLMQDGKLVLGPFQGPVACFRIARGRGVCGTAFEKKRTIVVPDVEEFPGHIACSSLSRSEIVVPVVRDGAVRAVLDIDSTTVGFFDETDAVWLEMVAEIV